MDSIERFMFYIMWCMIWFILGWTVFYDILVRVINGQ